MAKLRERRRVLVIDPAIQFRYLVLPLIVAFTTSVCLLVLFVLQVQNLKALVEPTDKALIREISSLKVMTGVVVGVVLLLHVALIVWLGLSASHKVAGPVYRLKKAMEEAAAGSRGVRVHLRDGDLLSDAAEAFNSMMESLQRREDGSAAGEEEAEEIGGK